MMIQTGLLDEDLLRGAMVDVAVETGKTGPSNLHLASYSYAIIQKSILLIKLINIQKPGKYGVITFHFISEQTYLYTFKNRINAYLE
jgi:hypothetical protein